jgi:AbiU2
LRSGAGGSTAGRSSNEIYALFLHRATYRRVGEIVQDHGQLPESYFWRYLQDTYAATQAIAVRRQAETSSRVISLGRLLAELSDSPEEASRAFFVGLWAGERRAGAEREFDERFAGSVGTHLDPAIPRADLKTITDSAEPLKTFVDEHLAHSDARAGKDLPTFAQLEVAIDEMGELLKKYVYLFKASTLMELVPLIQHNWEAIFRQAWIRP